MKKKHSYFALVLALVLLMLCACGNSGEAKNDVPEGMKSILPGANQTSDDVQTEETPEAVTEEPAIEDNEQQKIAEELIGSEVSALFDAIGEPDSTDYASSCLGPGEDGELHYNGFTVYTYREGDTEIIQDVIG